MIHGKLIKLRMIKQSDLDEIIEKCSDLTQRGEFLNLNMINEVAYKKDYQENGFWSDEFGAMVITDKEGRLLGVSPFSKGLSIFPVMR